MPNKAALHAYIESVVGGAFNVQTSQVTLGAAATRVLQANFERMAAVIINISAVDIYVLMNNGVSSTNGIKLGANGGALTLSANPDLAMVGWDWWAIPASATPTITVIETIRYAVDSTNAPLNQNPIT